MLCYATIFSLLTLNVYSGPATMPYLFDFSTLRAFFFLAAYIAMMYILYIYIYIIIIVYYKKTIQYI
jgi:hypothetical protein